jgi:hypothetical protein
MSATAPLILLTSPHSLGSRLSMMLGQHAGIFAPPELCLLPALRLVDLFDQLPRQRLDGLLRTLAQLHAGEQSIESIEMARRWLFRRARLETTDILAELCARVAPRQLILTSDLLCAPANLGRLPALRDAFPHARFLHLTRHPWHQCRAWLTDPDALPQLYQLDSLDAKTHASGPSRVPDPQIDWYRRQQGILAFLREVPAALQYHLRAEDLCADPRLTLARICAWLQLPRNREYLDAMRQPQGSAYACPGPYGAETGLDAEFLINPAAMPPPPQPVPLDQPLPWRPDRAPFRPQLIDLARLLGYD